MEDGGGGEEKDGNMVCRMRREGWEDGKRGYRMGTGQDGLGAQCTKCIDKARGSIRQLRTAHTCTRNCRQWLTK